jgi:hypothetical protein
VKKNSGGKDAACPSVLKLVTIIQSTGKKNKNTSTQVSKVVRYPITLRRVNRLVVLISGRAGPVVCDLVLSRVVDISSAPR